MTVPSQRLARLFGQEMMDVLEEHSILYHNLPLHDLLSSEKHVFDQQVS